MKQVTVSVTSVKIPGNEILGTAERELHYLKIENNGVHALINVGEKTIKTVTAVLNAPDAKKEKGK